jgi:hypothetical protein
VMWHDRSGDTFIWELLLPAVDDELLSSLMSDMWCSTVVVLAWIKQHAHRCSSSESVANV